MQNILREKGIFFEESKDSFGCEIFVIAKSDLLNTVKLIRKDFDMLLSVSAVDVVENFEVIYNFYSTISNKKLILKVVLGKSNPSVESLCGVYNSANWHERECYDLMGIEFLNHPNMERILMPKDWIGYPLRKDYKMEDDRLSWNMR